MIRQHIIEHHKLGLHKIARTQVAPQNLREEFHWLLPNGRPQPLLLRRVAEGLVNRPSISTRSIASTSSHCATNAFTNCCDLGSTTMRSTCAASTFGWSMPPPESASCRNVASGMLLREIRHRAAAHARSADAPCHWPVPSDTGNRRHQRHHQHLAQGILEGCSRQQFGRTSRSDPLPHPSPVGVVPRGKRHHLPRIPRLIRLALIRLKENPPMLRRRPLLKYRPFKPTNPRATSDTLFPLRLLFSALD